jgi:hypothetical protein
MEQNEELDEELDEALDDELDEEFDVGVELGPVPEFAAGNPCVGLSLPNDPGGGVIPFGFVVVFSSALEPSVDSSISSISSP